MKRFLLWGHDQYYPSVANRDFKGDFDELIEMVDFKFNSKNKCEFWVYLDTVTGNWFDL